MKAHNKIARVNTSVPLIQIAMQVYRLPGKVPPLPMLVEKYDSNFGSTKGKEKNTLLPHLLSDIPRARDLVDSDPVAHGKFFANNLIRCQNRYDFDLQDLSEWAVSPAYKVDWPVGKHEPVGVYDDPREQRPLPWMVED